jgi:predicted aspartyl protease
MLILTFDYSNSYYPAAPVAEITIQDADRHEQVVNLIALVDSGADASMIPVNILEKIGATYVTTKGMRGITGPAHPVDIFLVTIQVGDVTVPMVEAIALQHGTEAIIGRDVLNYLVVTLNGLAGMVEIVQET